MDFTVGYGLSPDEAARALHQGLKRQLRTFFYILPSILVVGGLVCVVADAIIIGVGMFAGAVIVPFAATWEVRRIARRQLAYLSVPVTLRVTGDGYECRAEQFTNTMRWSVFGQVVTTREFWLFYVNRQFTAFLPKRAFDSEQQAAIEDLIAARWNDRAT